MADNRAECEGIVVTGGAPLDPTALAALPRPAFVVVAADGGLDHTLAAGIEPDALVGDLDSVSDVALAWASDHIDVVRHPADKARTDTELAIAHVLSLNPIRLTLLAGAGDRLDHTLAALGALGAPALDRVPAVEAWWGTDHLHIATPRRPVAVDEPAGTTFSVLAMHGPATGVSVTGARWPLDAVELGPLVGWGVSNEVLTPPVHVAVGDGVITVIIPASSATTSSTATSSIARSSTAGDHP